MTSRIFASWWWSVLMYSVSLSLFWVALRFSRYRLHVLGASEAWYVGVVALVFVGLGIWAGLQLSRRTVPVESAPSFRPKAEVLAGLGITPREWEVLEQMALGLSNQEIAEKLFVSLNTIKTHTSNVFSKLGVQRRTQAIQKAKDLGLLS
jgi:two-component system, NarL family, response regulator LiaR